MRIEYRWQYFVFNINQFQGGLRGYVVDGGNGSDLLTDMYDPIAGQYFLIWWIARRFDKTVFDAFGILYRDHTFDTVQGFGLAEINADDFGVGMRTPQYPARQHSRQPDILTVDRPAGDFIRTVLTFDTFADMPQLVHQISSFIAGAV
jgi:hypothetical protein